MTRTNEQAREYMKRWRQQNPEKTREIAKKYRDTHPEQIRESGKRRYVAQPPGKVAEKTRAYRQANPLRFLLAACKARAKRKGLPFDLTLGDLTVPEFCPVLGIPLAFSRGKTPNTPSVDRIDNMKGYTKDNVLIVSWRANSLKSDATLMELQAVAKFYSKFVPSGEV